MTTTGAPLNPTLRAPVSRGSAPTCSAPPAPFRLRGEARQTPETLRRKRQRGEGTRRASPGQRRRKLNKARLVLPSLKVAASTELNEREQNSHTAGVASGPLSNLFQGFPFRPEKAQLPPLRNSSLKLPPASCAASGGLFCEVT